VLALPTDDVVRKDENVCQMVSFQRINCSLCCSKTLLGLDFAAALGDGRVVAELMALRVPIGRGDATGKTPLHWASVLGRTSVVRLLLQGIKF
jgi:ankyrin repeat protein